MHRISDGGACRRLGLGTMRALTMALAFAVLVACGGRHDEREELHQAPAGLDTRAAAGPARTNPGASRIFRFWS